MSERRSNLAACLIAVVVLAVVCVLVGWGLAFLVGWWSQTQEPSPPLPPSPRPEMLEKQVQVLREIGASPRTIAIAEAVARSAALARPGEASKSEVNGG